jgi:fibronectin type 3 domain-containing protein
MYSTKSNHLQRLAQRVFFFVVVLSLLLCNPILAAESKNILPCSRITVSLAPNLRTILFNKIAILPFLADDPQLAATFTEAFSSSLAQTGKYAILPTDEFSGWQDILKLSETPEKQTVIRFGRTLKVRGVIAAIISSSEAVSLKDKKTVTALKISIRMTDTQTGKTAWSLVTECKSRAYNKRITAEQAKQIMDKSLAKLIQQMVKEGDIFSPLLPTPTVISSKGDLRKIRVVLQPDPQYLYSSYQLLTADNPLGVFTPHTAPANNDQGPIILEETGLADGKHYYCTIIGRTPAGLANIPAHPFAVTTSGAPKPLPYLQVSGNNLRHIQLQWAPSQDPHVTGYTIYRSTTANGSFEKIADVPGRERQSYTDYGEHRKNSYGSLADDTLYYYTIRTRNKFGIESKGAPVVSARTKGSPTAPTEIQAIDNQPGKIPLFWQPAEDPDIKGYAIFRKTGEQQKLEQIDFVYGRDSQKYVDTGSWTTPLKNNTAYSYRIRSINVVDLSSQDSATVTATTKPAPSAVQGIHVSQNRFREVKLQWQPNPENDITGYEIFRGQTKDELHRIASVDAGQTRYADDDLRDGSTYWYQIRAIDSDHLKGEMSLPVTATTRPRPQPPTNLQASIVPQGIMLKWQQPEKKTVDHYEISTPGFLASKLGETTENFFLHVIHPQKGETYRFLVRAVDKDGLTSDPSRQVTIRIPSAGK